MYAHRTAKLPVPVHIPQGNSHKVTAVIKLKRPLFYLYGGAAAVLALLLLIRGDAAAQGVRDGIDLCVTSVIPALFPFFAASQLLVSLGAAEALGRAAGPLFRRLFGMDGAGAAAYLLGLIGGYPLGAKTAESLVRQGLLTPEDGALLLTFCNNAGPAFILGIAGSGVFRSSRAGVWLYLIHAAAATATGLLFCFIRKYIRKQNISGFFRFSASSCNFPSTTAQKRPPLSAPAALIGAVRGGVAAMAGVCGFVIFFLVLLRLGESFLGPLPPLAAGLVELTNGILRLTPDRGGFVLAAALLSLLHLPQTAIRWADIVLLAAVGVGMIVPKVMEILERPFARIAPRTAGDGAGFGLGLVLGAAFVPCAGPVLTSVIVASNNGQFTWRIVGLAISFAVGVSIPLLAVAMAGSGAAASFLKSRQRPLRIAAGVAMIALAIGIATNAPAALQRIIPDYTASLQAGDDEACDTGACDPETAVEARGDFAQCARDLGTDCGVLPTIVSSEWINALGQPTGTVTLVDFWSSSCTNCQREIPELERIYEKYKDYGLVVIGVHSPQQAYERDPAVVSGAVSRLGITYPVALDPELTDFQTYGASAWPTHYIAGADGQLRSVGRGIAGVEEQIRALLTEAGAALPD